MNSLILRTATRYLFPLLVLLSFYLLVRGHNEPGGGFAGGLVAASAVALYAVAHGARPAARLLPFDNHTLIGAGLLAAAGSGFLAVFSNRPFLTGLWTSIHLGRVGEVSLGTPLLFDIGVYLVVVGVSLMVILTIGAEE